MEGAVEQDRVQGVFGGAAFNGWGQRDASGGLAVAGGQFTDGPEFVAVAQAEVAHVAIELADAFGIHVAGRGLP